MACGEIPKPVYGEDKRAPMTRMGNLALQRAASLKVEKLQTDWARQREAESLWIATEAKARRPARASCRRARYGSPRAREILPGGPARGRGGVGGSPLLAPGRAMRPRSTRAPDFETSTEETDRSRAAVMMMM